mmetsp:Transcript_48486/g.115281  ORF Transcript_48486/g.115281 Transcript_48486/m.115281 type:complete len:132 (-) Transcript_48486:52-447(-)
MSYFGTLEYQKHCLLEPVVPSALWAGLFTGLEAAQGMPRPWERFPSLFGLLYAYNAMQCPMEAITGRRSLWHNFIAAGSLGAIGVQRGSVGVPFVTPDLYYRYPSLTPVHAAFLVYGSLAACLGAIGGKTF